MQKRTLKVALLAVLAIAPGVGNLHGGPRGPDVDDLPDTVTAKYGVTDNQVAAISEGYPGGLWKPYQTVTRAQFTKMAVAAFNIPLADPATASYTDVPKGSYYYQYIEGAKAAGVVNGTSATDLQPQRQHHPSAGYRHRCPLYRQGSGLQPGHHVHGRRDRPSCSRISAMRPASPLISRTKSRSRTTWVSPTATTSATSIRWPT